MERINMESIVKSNSPAMSEDIRAIATAFLLAKKEFMATGFGGTNSHQKYKYAKIEDIYNAIERGLSNNNIIIWHFAQPIDGIEYLHTRLIHTLTGQYIEDCRILESEKPGNQGKGAANTYMKKYALLSLCAIATEDDDGEDEERYIYKRSQEPMLSSEQISIIQSLIKSAANAKILYNNILKFNKVHDLSQLSSTSFEHIKTYIANNKEI